MLLIPCIIKKRASGKDGIVNGHPLANARLLGDSKVSLRLSGRALREEDNNAAQQDAEA